MLIVLFISYLNGSVSLEIIYDVKLHVYLSILNQI